MALVCGFVCGRLSIKVIDMEKPSFLWVAHSLVRNPTLYKTVKTELSTDRQSSRIYSPPLLTMNVM